MDSMTTIAVTSIITAGITAGFGTMGPALAGRAGRGHRVDVTGPAPTLLPPSPAPCSWASQ